MERSPYFRIRSGLRQKIIKFLNHYSEKKNIEYFIEDKNAFAQYVTTFLVAFSGNKVVSLHLVGDDTMAFGDMLFTQDFLSCNIALGNGVSNETVLKCVKHIVDAFHFQWKQEADCAKRLNALFMRQCISDESFPFREARQATAREDFALGTDLFILHKTMWVPCNIKGSRRLLDEHKKKYPRVLGFVYRPNFSNEQIISELNVVFSER